jgi:hypothetical protein
MYQRLKIAKALEPLAPTATGDLLCVRKACPALTEAPMNFCQAVFSPDPGHVRGAAAECTRRQC